MHQIAATAPLDFPVAIAVSADRPDKCPAGSSSVADSHGTSPMQIRPSGAPMVRPGGGDRRLRSGNPRGRQGGTLMQAARPTEREHDDMPSLPPGACPGGETVRLDGATAGMGSVLGVRQGERLDQGARPDEREQESMNRETVRLDGTTAGMGSVPGLRQRGSLGQRARPAEREHDDMPSLPPGACPGGETVRLDGADAAAGSVPGRCQGGSLGQGARSVEREQDLMKRETVRLDGVDTGVGLVPGVRQGESLDQGVRPTEREQVSMNRETVRLDGVEAGVGSVPGVRQAESLGQWARPTEREHNDMPSLPPGACPGGETVRLDGATAGIGSVPGPRQGGSLAQGTRPAEREQESMNRETVQSDAATAGMGSVPGLRQGGTLRQWARPAEREQESMNRETVGLDGATAGVGSVPGLRQGGSLHQRARSAEREQDPIQRDTVRLGAVDAAVGWVPGLRQGWTLGQAAQSDEREQDPIQRGTVVVRPAALGGADGADGDRDAMMRLPPGACSGGGAAAAMQAWVAGSGATVAPTPPAGPPPTWIPFAAQALQGRGRIALVSSTVCNEPAVHKRAAQVEREGGRTVQVPIHAAEQAVRDWRRAGAQAPRRMADATNRVRARRILRVGSVADVPRWDGRCVMTLLRALRVLRGGSCWRAGAARPNCARRGRCGRLTLTWIAARSDPRVKRPQASPGPLFAAKPARAGEVKNRARGATPQPCSKCDPPAGPGIAFDTAARPRQSLPLPWTRP
jgi:hypothetical protein